MSRESNPKQRVSTGRKRRRTAPDLVVPGATTGRLNAESSAQIHRLQERIMDLERTVELLRAREYEARWLGRFPDENPNPVLRMSAEGIVLYRNPAAAASTIWECQVGKPLPHESVSRLASDALSENRSILRDIELNGLCFSVSAAPVRSEKYVNVYARDISEYWRAQKELRASEARYRELVQNANSAIIRWRSDGTLTFFNEYAQSFFGYEAGEIIGKHVGILIPDKDSTGTDMGALVKAILSHPERYAQNINENVCRDGRRVWMAWTNRPVIDEKGKVSEILAVGSDITELRRMEEALRESEEKFRSAFANAAIGLAMTNPDGRFLDTNAAYCQLTGYSIDELRSTRFQDLIHPDDAAENIRLIDQMLAGEIPNFIIENRYICKGGTPVWVRKSVSLVRHSDGAPKWIISLIQDITEQRRAEESLIHSEARFRALAEALPQIVWTANAAGEVEWFNRRWSEYTGEPSGSGEGWNWGKIVHPDDLAETLKKWERTLMRGGLFEMENRSRRHDGEYRWFLVRAWPMKDGKGNIVRWFGTNTDIHDLKETEAALRQKREDFARAQEVGQIGWWRMNVQRNILTWSDENYRIFGVPQGAPLNYEGFLATCHPDDREYVDMRWKASLRGEPYDIEHRVVADGQVKWVREKAYLEFDEKGNLQGGFGITQDITERKKAEQKIHQLNATLEQRVIARTAEVSRQADQLRALASQLGQMEQRERKRLSSILHDHIQQLLIAAQMHLGLVRHADTDSLESTVQDVESILREAVDAARSLAVDMSPPILHQGGLAPALGWLAGRMEEKNLFKVRVKADSSAEPQDEPVRMLLFESVRELLLNAVKHSGVREAELVMMRNPDGWTKIIVADEGTGFDPRVMDSSHGGLGLFGIQQRLSYLGGNMVVESTPGRGARVILMAPPRGRRPKAPAPAPAKSKIDMPQEPSKAGKRKKIGILLVDDHQIVRNGLSSLLQLEADFEVVGEAEEGKQALELARRFKPDVVVTDISMQGMDGLELTRILHQEMPNVKVLGLSMHIEKDIAKAMIEAGAAGYLTKGGLSEDLISAIRACASHS